MNIDLYPWLVHSHNLPKIGILRWGAKTTVTNIFWYLTPGINQKSTFATSLCPPWGIWSGKVGQHTQNWLTLTLVKKNPRSDFVPRYVWMFTPLFKVCTCIHRYSRGNFTTGGQLHHWGSNWYALQCDVVGRVIELKVRAQGTYFQKLFANKFAKTLAFFF
jgi:hypothetical protein